MYPQVFGKYVLERELARGGMARVLLATLRGAGGFEKRLVVKQIRDELALDTEFVGRFVEEAKTTVALSHPNIVPVYELGVEQGTYFLAMELVDGASLSEILDPKREGKTPLSPEQGAYVGVEICRALDYAHRRMQVVHRDITPRNVMVDEEGQIKLIDFGIAARAQVSGDGGRVFGSPGHMPPEQMEGRELGPPTDLFAVAVLLMEMWSGKPPFRRKTPEETAEAMKGPAPKPSSVDPRLAPLDDVVGRALSLNPEERPQTADDFARVLRRFLAEVDLGDVARSLGDRAREARREASLRAEAETAPSMRPREPSHVEMVTKTFAARDDMLPEAPPEPSTRRLSSERPPSSEPRVETVATRPLETPVGEFPPPGAAAPRAGTSKVWIPLAALAAAAAFAVGVGSLSRSGQGGAASTPTPAATPTSNITGRSPEGTESSHVDGSVRTLVTPTPTSTSNITGRSPEGTESSYVDGSVRTLVTSTSTSTSTVAVPAPSVAVGEGRLAVFCDPETKVTIDGAAKGSCPLNLTVETGPHEVRFVFVPTGESRGERVHVAKDKRVTLRADFTGSSPLIRVER